MLAVVEKSRNKYDMSNRTPSDPDEVRRKDRERKATQRSEGREIFIPDVVNPQRRERCMADPELFLKTYMPVKFKNPFCRHHIAMIDGLEECLHYDGWQSMAAPRGDGKSSICEGMIIRAICCGLRHFVVLIGATETDAQQRKQAIALVFEEGKFIMEDFPEICWPIRELGKSGRKGNQQTVEGEFTNIQWPSGVKAREMRFPTVPGSLSSGAWLVIRGMEKGKVRGTKYGDDRPDLVILDDVESEDSTRSDGRTELIEKKIDREVTPLAGPNTGLAIFMPCTIIALGCIADRFTNPQKYPEHAAWMGQRYGAVVQWPTCHGLDGEADLWAVYRRQCRQDALDGDRTGRVAHQMYLDQREAMDAGCIVSNEYRYISKRCKDGSELESSTIEGLMRFIARKGDNERAWSIMRAEYMNEPDESNAPEGSDCSIEIILRSVNGVRQGVCPAGTQFLTAGQDVHKERVYVIVVAWVGSHGHIIHYEPLHTLAKETPMRGNADATENVKRAILVTLREWRDATAGGWAVEDGGMKKLDRVCVDARWQSDTIYKFIAESPRPTYQAITGTGKGKSYTNYRPPHKNSKHARIGRFHYYAMWQEGRGAWLIHADSDYWKGHIQEAFVSNDAAGDTWTTATPDAMSLYGKDKLWHKEIAPQIMAEELTTRFVAGRGMESNWVVKHYLNHYLDCLVYACSAAALAGVRFGHMAEIKTKQRRTGPVRVAGTATIG